MVRNAFSLVLLFSLFFCAPAISADHFLASADVSARCETDLLTGPDQGRDVILFDSAGNFSSGYAATGDWIKPGDRLIFSNNRAFRITKILGRGGTTFIMAIADGRALRVPSKAEAGYQEQLNEYLDGRNELSEVPDSSSHIVKVFVEESRRSQFVIVSRVQNLFSMEEFLAAKGLIRGLEEFKGFSTRSLFKDLVDFAEAFAPYEAIGDFRPDQVFWTGEHWVLLDWEKGSRKAKSIHSPHVLWNHLGNVPLLQKREIKSAIAQKRRTLGLPED